MDVGEAVEIFSVRARAALQRCFEVALRLPGLLLFEIWWRNRDFQFAPDILKQSFSSYLEMDHIIEFIQTRSFDQVAAQILSYTGILSLSFFGFAHICE